MIIVRYSELGLKGNNRTFFEKRLIKNIKHCLKNNNLPSAEVRRIRGRILVDSGEESVQFLKHVFGIASVSNATSVPKELDEMKKAALDFAKEREFDTFRITCHRIDPRFLIDSMTLERDIGEAVFETLHKKVSLKNPELNIQFEIADQAYLFSEKIEGPGGLPIGSEGRVMVIMEKESYHRCLLSAYLLLKRGCSILPIGESEPDLSPLGKYSAGGKLNFHKIKGYDGIDRLAAEKKILGIVVPDTIQDLKAYPFKLTTLRPLVGYTEKDIDEKIKALFQ